MWLFMLYIDIGPSVQASPSVQVGVSVAEWAKQNSDILADDMHAFTEFKNPRPIVSFCVCSAYLYYSESLTIIKSNQSSDQWNKKTYF